MERSLRDRRRRQSPPPQLSLKPKATTASAAIRRHLAVSPGDPRSGSRIWGHHLIININGISPEVPIRDENALVDFVNRIIEINEMKAWGDPLVARLDGHTHLAGLSIVQLIRTSNITLHIAEEIGAAFFDIFTCGKLNFHDTMIEIQTFFKARQIRHLILERS